MAEISPANRSIKLNNRILNRINETMNGSQSQLQSLLTSAANAVSSMISSSPSSASSSASSSSSTNGTASPHLVINSGSSSSSSSSQHTPNNNNNHHNNSQLGMSTLTSTNTSFVLPSNWSYNHSITMSVKLEKKMFDKINKLADKLLKYCQSEHMRLINSPPYIIDILPDICQIFNTVYFMYENRLAQLNEIDYFCVLIQNCTSKFQELIELFKMAGKRMYEETSAERQKFVKYTLTYSHILAEMKSMFPKDTYEGESFRIAKRDAADFWKMNFGDRVIVSWREFELKLNRVHQITNEMEMKSLRETIQLTKSNYVSIFEFDIFTRLFQPWNNLLNNWKFLVTEHPGYSAFSTYDEVHKRLQKHINKPGSYLFRLSCTKLGQWAIGYVTHDHKILQTIPQSLIQALIDGQKQGLYVYPDGRDIKIDISSAIAIMSASRIQCSREQYEMYCDVGSSFQICKICSENNKDRKLEPCGHLICSSCLENWQELHAQPSCPFCRCEIKTFEPVIVSPFESSGGGGGGGANSRAPRRSQSTISDDSNSIGSGSGKVESLMKRKSSAKLTKENQESLSTLGANTSGESKSSSSSSSSSTRSESMRCGGGGSVDSSSSKQSLQRSLLTSIEQQQQQQQQKSVDNSSRHSGANLQATSSLNSLSTTLTTTTSSSNLNSELVNVSHHQRFHEEEDGYLKPSKITSQASSLPNSSLHLRPLNQDVESTTTTTGSLNGIAVDKNSSIEDSSASSSSIDTQNQASNSSSSSKFNLDQLLGVGSTITTTHHERSPPSTISNKPERESLLPPPPPPIPSARSTNLASLSRAPSNATGGVTTSTSTTKLPGLPTTAPPQIPPPPATGSKSVLVPPLQPPPALPHQTPNTHSPPNSISPTTTTTTSPIVSSDASNHIKSSSIRLRVENEIRLEQAMSQLGCDRVRAACVLYLAGSDLKLAKSILKSSAITEN